jgi:hypothetical protein
MSSRTWREGVLAAPAVGVSLLPKLVCPLCSPAYAALLSSMGLGFLISARYLLPLTAAFLVLALAGLRFRSSSRHGQGPFLVGVAASTVVLTGKFWSDSSAAAYTGAGLLVLASVWSAVPRRSAVCPACLPIDASANQVKAE